jgi:hypothetical protein
MLEGYHEVYLQGDTLVFHQFFFVNSDLCTFFKCDDLNLEVTILNVYGPYLHKHVLWDTIFNS